MYSSQPFFSTLKRIERSFHSAVGSHNVTRWIDYTLDTVTWPDGRVTQHLGIVDRINGQVDRVASLGAADTKRWLANEQVS